MHIKRFLEHFLRFGWSCVQIITTHSRRCSWWVSAQCCTARPGRRPEPPATRDDWCDPRATATWRQVAGWPLPTCTCCKDKRQKVTSYAMRSIECVPYPLAGCRHHDNTQTNNYITHCPLHNADKASTGSPIG